MSKFVFLALERLPFDPNNPIGYLAAIILEYTILDYELYWIACTCALGVGAFLLAISLLKEIQCILHSINNSAKVKKHQSNELKVLFSEFIQVHAATKQLSIFQNNFLYLLPQ